MASNTGTFNRHRATIYMVTFAMSSLATRLSFSIFTPVWVDTVEVFPNATGNNSFADNSTTRNPRRISAMFITLTEPFITTLVYGVTTLFILACFPKKITSFDRTFPKRRFFYMAAPCGIFACLVNYTRSGTRVAPYLQALLSNFFLPLQIIVRYLILGKRPTCRKFTCAAIVLVAEFVCLLPSIFPQLESAQEKKVEGGAKGIWGILWPVIFVVSMIPATISSTILEKGAHDSRIRRTKKIQNENELINDGPQEAMGDTGQDMPMDEVREQVHLVHFMFWREMFVFLTVSCLFWTDIIPYFGTSGSFSEFIQNLWFGVQCQFGGAGCGAGSYMVGWVLYLTTVVDGLVQTGLVRYSEGATFSVIVNQLGTPVVFLFWTLFQEKPLQWCPHVALSTWLSIGAIAVMLPAMLLYHLGPPEIVIQRVKQKEIEHRGLLSDMPDQADALYT